MLGSNNKSKLIKSEMAALSDVCNNNNSEGKKWNMIADRLSLNKRKTGRKKNEYAKATARSAMRRERRRKKEIHIFPH